jgi:hypothetical protein
MQPTVAHRALADAQTTAFVFEKLMEPVGGWACCLCDAIREQGGPMGLMPASPRESLLPLELEEALEQRCAVRMEYLDARQQRTHRVVEPLTVRRSGGELLLIAWCHMRNDKRTFKLERIVQMSRVEAPALPAVVAGESAGSVHATPRRAEPLPQSNAESTDASAAEVVSIIDPTPCPPTEILPPAIESSPTLEASPS